MTKIAFCFPGQGSYEAGMGRDFAEAVPAAKDAPLAEAGVNVDTIVTSILLGVLLVPLTALSLALAPIAHAAAAFLRCCCSVRLSPPMK